MISTRDVAVPKYQLDITSSPNVQTCESASFSYTISPALNASSDVALTATVESTDDTFTMRLTQDALLSKTTWFWKQVSVPAGQYRLSMSAQSDQYIINGTSSPFFISTGDQNCSISASTSITPSDATISGADPTDAPAITPIEKNSHPSAGKIAGAIIGTLLGLLLLFGIFLVYWRRKVGRASRLERGGAIVPWPSIKTASHESAAFCPKDDKFGDGDLEKPLPRQPPSGAKLSRTSSTSTSSSFQSTMTTTLTLINEHEADFGKGMGNTNRDDGVHPPLSP